MNPPQNIPPVDERFSSDSTPEWDHKPVRSLFMSTMDKELRSALLAYAHVLPPSLITIGKLALSGPGKVMSSLAPVDGDLTSFVGWPMYVILSYQAAVEPERRDSWREVVPLAVAVEIAMSAADLLDELTDHDPSTVAATHGPGQALNTANLMLVMAQQILLGHATTHGERALVALSAFQDMLVQAAVGQHLDMLYEDMDLNEVTPEMSADMTAHKAGALIGGACRMGALMSGADSHVVELVARFGAELGGIAQLINDIQDVLPAAPEGDDTAHQHKTDLLLRKRTLPIVFALRDDAPEPNALQRAFSSAEPGQADEEELREAVISAGGVQFAQLVMEVHRENAGQILEELEQLRPGALKLLSPLLAQPQAASEG